MTVLDIGCGPGFFTIDMARMVGDSGRVIAADLQAAMLQKAQNVGLESAEGPRVLLSKTALLRKRPSPATA
jgi:ubiquinone/menaquinone biosynthesis C-methylase UbiE